MGTLAAWPGGLVGSGQMDSLDDEPGRHDKSAESSF